MPNCKIEPWSLKDLTDALKNMHKDNKEIIVPMFQRGKRWKKEQEDDFINSLQENYPIGTMLFYKTIENNKETYTLVDGLQRANTIKKFIFEPTRFFDSKSIPEEITDNIYKVLGLSGEEKVIKTKISNSIVSSIHECEFNRIQYDAFAENIIENFGLEYEKETIKMIKNILKPFLDDYKSKYDEIQNSQIPVIIYSGSEESLQLIFERINSKGTALPQYEIYAASWPINNRFKVDNSQIIEKVCLKYDSLLVDNYNVAGYNRKRMQSNKMLNAFEYAFGFSRYLNDNYDFLQFEKNTADDVIITTGFELINACINEKDKIKTLYENILEIDINKFEERLIEVILFVEKILAKITYFKGNNRNINKILHTKYQALSLISATFKEKYDINDLSQAKKTWTQNKSLLEKNMIQHYIYDIITNEWGEGGTHKIHSASKTKKYLQPIPITNWQTALDAYFQKSITRKEKGKKINGIKQEDIVILNCIYLKLFSASDQLSIDNFDIEHIATKDKMRKLIDKCNGEGLPISSIANLCYLPQGINRSKKNKTIYNDSTLNNTGKLIEIEKKFTFTKKDDLIWLDYSLKNGDFEGLKDLYLEFLNNRFKIQKQMFYKSLDIDYSELEKLQLATETV